MILLVILIGIRSRAPTRSRFIHIESSRVFDCKNLGGEREMINPDNRSFDILTYIFLSFFFRKIKFR